MTLKCFWHVWLWGGFEVGISLQIFICNDCADFNHTVQCSVQLTVSNLFNFCQDCISFIHCFCLVRARKEKNQSSFKIQICSIFWETILKNPFITWQKVPLYSFHYIAAKYTFSTKYWIQLNGRIYNKNISKYIENSIAW